MPKVVVVIVNWNTGELLAACLASLAQDHEQELIAEVIVVDNASTDRSVAQAKLQVGRLGNRPRVRFVQLDKNEGFARATNEALARITTSQHREAHALLLNPDTEVEAGAVRRLVEALEKHETVGVIGPRLLNTDRTQQPSVRSFPTLGVFVFFFLKLHRLRPNAGLWRRYMLPDFDYSTGKAVDQVMGAVFLIRRETLADVGVFDERFWVWFEEVDYCKRVHAAGWRVWYEPTARVLHHGGVSFYQLTGWRRAVPWLRSCRAYARKHLGAGAETILIVLFPLALLVTIPSVIAHIAQRRHATRKRYG